MEIDNFLKFEKKIAFVNESNQKYTYGKLLEKINNFSKFFKKKSIVLIICENNEETLFSYLSIYKKKFLGILIPSNLNNELINSIIKKFKPNYIVGNERYKFLDKNYFIKKKFNDTIIWSCRIKIKTSYHKNLAILLPTSGTTGSSKFVGLSYENISTNCEQIKKSLSLKTSDRSITILPLSYSYGLSVINSHLYAGSTIYLYKGSIIQKEFWNKVVENKITNFNLVPFTAEMLIRLNFEKLRSQNMRFITLAGGPLEYEKKKKLLEICEKKKISFFSMYGQTEASPRMACFNVNTNKSKIKSVGKVVEGGKFNILNAKNSQSKIGEVIFEGKNVFCGYFSGWKDLCSKYIYKKKLKTGDLGYLDKDGFLFITSRKKRIAKIFGLRIDLVDLESHIRKEFKIENACISNDKIIRIHVRLNAKSKKIKNFLNKKFKININHIEIKYIKSFPKNAKMQIDYNKLNNNEY